jgi:hypothetical protein
MLLSIGMPTGLLHSPLQEKSMAGVYFIISPLETSKKGRGGGGDTIYIGII